MTTESRRADLLAIASILAATLLLYREALGLFWIYDTPAHLDRLETFSAGEFLSSRAAWRTPWKTFTPLLELSLAFDRRVAEGSTVFAYGHLLASIAASALALFALLRRRVAPVFAAGGALLFLVGPAVAATAPELMSRHYFEALALAGVSALAALRAEDGERGRRIFRAVSAGAYFAALLAKVVVVGLPILLFLGSTGTRTERARRLAGHALALGAYVGLRAAFLEHPAGAYGMLHPGGPGALLVELPRRLSAEIFGSPPILALLTAVSLSLLLAARGAGDLRTTGAAMALAVAPILPVSFALESRHVLALWFVLAGAASLGAVRFVERSRAHVPHRAIASAAVVVLFLVAGRAAWAGAFHDANLRSGEGRALLGLHSGDVLAEPVSLAASLSDLERWAARTGRSSGAAEWYQDARWLCADDRSGKTVWRLNAAGHLEDVTRSVLAAANGACDEAHSTGPLSAHFEWRGENLYWRLGPESAGRFSFLFDDGAARVDVPARGGYRSAPRDLVVRVRRSGPAGEATYSPEIRLVAGRPFDWDRNAESAPAR